MTVGNAFDDEREFWNLLRQLEGHWTIPLSGSSSDDDYWRALIGMMAHAVIERRCQEQRPRFWILILAIFDVLSDDNSRLKLVEFLRENASGPDSPLERLRSFIARGCESTDGDWYRTYLIWLWDWLRRLRERDNSR